MQIHQIKAVKQKIHRRRGRGGKRGTYSGRGIKGQNARAGSSRKPAILDFIQKIPKLHGVPASRYKKQGVKQWKTMYAILHIDTLDKNFKDGEIVSPKTLLEKKLVRTIKGKAPSVKVLARGELKKKLTFEGVEMSASAKVKAQIQGTKVQAKS